MLEVAQSDFFESEEETTALLASLVNIFRREQTADELLAAARTDKSNSAGLYQFTRLACTEMSIEERCSLVEQLWQIAFADGVIDKYEGAIRKMSDLLYVPHGEFIKATRRKNGRRQPSHVVRHAIWRIVFGLWSLSMLLSRCWGRESNALFGPKSLNGRQH